MLARVRPGGAAWWRLGRLLSLMCCLAVTAVRAEAPAVAAAADLRFALEEMAENFRRQSGQELKLSFGSSGNFRRQIAMGAPFELYLSADEAYVRALHEEGLTLDDGVLYAVGRIVLFAPHGSLLEPDADFTGLTSALEAGKLGRFAIANPEHAPYGRAAREALQHAGLWERIQPHLVLGENAAQTARFASSGSADGGLMPYSLALAPSFAGRGSYVLIPETWHDPLRQRMVLLRGAGETARRFYAYLQSPPARGVFRRYGFVNPDEG